MMNALTITWRQFLFIGRQDLIDYNYMNLQISDLFTHLGMKITDLLNTDIHTQ